MTATNITSISLPGMASPLEKLMLRRRRGACYPKQHTIGRKCKMPPKGGNCEEDCDGEP